MSGLDSTFLDPQAGGDGAMAVTAGQSILAMGDTEKAALGENNKQPRYISQQDCLRASTHLNCFINLVNSS